MDFVLPAAPVSVVRVVQQLIPADFEYIGVGESSHVVELRSRVEGYLESIQYKEGGLVQQGDLLFVVDQRPFIAAVESAFGVLDKQKAVLWNAEQMRHRMTPLYQQNAVSQKDFDQAVASELSAKASVKSAEADLYQAQLNLDFASIRSPVTGLASEAKYREGALISPQAHNLLTTIYVVDPIWVNFSVSDRDLLHVRKLVETQAMVLPQDNHFQVEAILSDGTVIPSEGIIDFMSPAIQQNTSTRMIRSVIPNPDLKIRPGQYVRVVIRGAVRPQAIAIPQTAIQQGRNGPFVFLVKEGKAVVQTVKLGDWYKDHWVIDEGLKVGDVVVVKGGSKLLNGTAVSIQNLEEPIQ